VTEPDGFIHDWEPDEWDVINANEADDYRYENDEYAAEDEHLEGQYDETFGGDAYDDQG
jgi:hypothetical protein